MKLVMPRYRYLTALLFLTLALAGGCRNRSANNSGSTGTVIDFASPLLHAIDVSPDGTGPYQMSGITYRHSLISRQEGGRNQFYVAGEVNLDRDDLGVDWARAVAVSEATGGARAGRTSDSAKGPTVGGVAFVTKPFVNQLTQVPILNIFTAVSSLAEAISLGLAVTACYAAADSTFAVMSGVAGSNVAVTAPSLQTTPETAMVTEPPGLRVYTVLNPANPIIVTINTIAKSCTIQVPGKVPFVGYAVSAGAAVPLNDGTYN